MIPHVLQVLHADLQDVELEKATVIVLYLLPEAIATIRDKLLACLDRGCRIICQCWKITDLEYSATEDSCYGNVTLYLYKKQNVIEKPDCLESRVIACLQNELSSLTAQNLLLKESIQQQ